MKAVQLELFRSLPPGVLEAAGVTRRYAAGEVAFTQGDPTTGLWVVLEGRLAMERVGPDGVVYTTGVQLPGEMVGMAGLWDQSGYPASARALETPTVLLWMSREQFFALHRRYPEFALAVSRSLAARLRLVLETIADTRGRPVPRQLAVFLSTLYRRSGPDIALTHEDLAHMIGVRRETVSRVLREFAQRGWIAVHYGRIRVLDPTPLEAVGELMSDDG
ncbi:cAMP-binding proteins - catabolite gene activator and regulatory subunit of cAMP-dependent protein kinases [Candidatus Hydrogenisulfobacillus filiaventi]|uniref:cAMP-binding proteins - catabolite gene activator and regulatory subunit of cAMP-dependent protein kinases n=1 Tax=Candidatus Hydrogenisulfobacillus filiaventi TaxID=2707344 RepID=A0A6F8ZDU2_9FIRM|nr:Crp/Fnr family transcriptional regulator [Bacillota bacterium]CAB1128176.1 cAMP-binding proteins - catabolite gene activator and regulatory subunit of cAMP-dependent protein kinases [Candidatus Hydrogenisulfobacillus filiaventi]